jgi:hypothetical protein
MESSFYRTCAAIAHHPHQVWSVYCGKIWEDKELLSLISEKIEWESPPSFWLLRILTSLRDQVRRLVA